MRLKFICEVHSVSGNSPNGKCLLCVYDEMNTES
jgi:hypothetical protein